MFSVVVLFFDEKGCLVRGRRLLLKGEEDFRGSGGVDPEEKCLANSSLKEGIFEEVGFVPGVGPSLKEGVFA